ncbi:hypothetical protein ACLZX5_00335 [Enterococcus faecium]
MILFITLVWIGFIGLFIYGLSSLGFSETISMFTVPTIGILSLTLILSIFTFISDKIPDFLGIVSSFFLSIPKFLWGLKKLKKLKNKTFKGKNMFSKKKYVQFIEQRDIELPETPVEIYRVFIYLNRKTIG